MKLRPLSEDEYRARKILTEIVAPCVTALGILAGVYQFHAGARKTAELQAALAARADSVEFRRRVWQEQLETYRKLAAAVGAVAASADAAGASDAAARARFESAAREFETLYWGATVIVGDRALDEQLARHLRDLHLAVGDIQRGAEGAPFRVKVLSDSTLTAAQASLRRGWQDITPRPMASQTAPRQEVAPGQEAAGHVAPRRASPAP